MVVVLEVCLHCLPLLGDLVRSPWYEDALFTSLKDWRPGARSAQQKVSLKNGKVVQEPETILVITSQQKAVSAFEDVFQVRSIDTLRFAVQPDGVERPNSSELELLGADGRCWEMAGEGHMII